MHEHGEVCAEALCDERARRCTVLELLQAAPAIGRIKAARICARTGISPTRRIEDLGRDDRIALGQKLA